MHGHLLLTPPHQLTTSSLNPADTHGGTQLLPLQGAAAASCMGCGRPQQQLQQQQSAAGLATQTLAAQGSSAGGLHGPHQAGGVQADVGTSAAAAAAAPAMPTLGSSHQMAAAHTAAGMMPPPAQQHAAALASAPPYSLLRLTDTRKLGQLALPSEVLQQLYGYLGPDELQGLHMVNKYLAGAMLQQRVRQVGRLGACVAALRKLGSAVITAAAAAGADGSGDDAGSSVAAAAAALTSSAADTSAAAAAAGHESGAVVAQPAADGAGAMGLHLDVAITQGSRQYELKQVSRSRQQLASADSLIAQLAAAAGKPQQQPAAPQLAVVLGGGGGGSSISSNTGLVQLQLQAAQSSTNHANVSVRLTAGSAEEAAELWEALVNRYDVLV
jgi:hypothetical protein